MVAFSMCALTFKRCGRNASKSSSHNRALAMNWSLITKASERLNLIQLGLVQNFWASERWSVTLSGSLLIQIRTKWKSTLK